jgi:uncharacterized protein (DUF302 family)
MTLQKKLDVDFRKYRILGAFNPQFTYKALKAESRIGTMLPCNVIVQETEQKKIKVSAIDPIASMQPVENQELKDIAHQVQAELKKVWSVYNLMFSEVFYEDQFLFRPTGLLGDCRV